KWVEKTTPWDAGQAAPPLVSILHTVNKGRVLVPGCGRVITPSSPLTPCLTFFSHRVTRWLPSTALAIARWWGWISLRLRWRLPRPTLRVWGPSLRRRRSRLPWQTFSRSLLQQSLTLSLTTRKRGFHMPLCLIDGFF